jgi:glycogen operon protein
VRAYWKGDGGLIGDARRLTGSSDLYEASGASLHASINYVTAHDGFTLADLVSYNDKHNEANLENNRDGQDNNLSWNCGVGATDDPDINACAPGRNAASSALLLSQGADAAGRRRDRPHNGGMPTARTTRSRGWTGVLTRMERPCSCCSSV